jgi:large subunit ribosomal protein L22
MSIAARFKRKRNESPGVPEFRSSYKHARICPRKVRLVVDMIRGLPVDEALNVLKFSRKRAATFVDKALKSAIANADCAVNENRVKQDIDVQDLYVHEARADEGPRLKRFRARARGMWFPYQRRYAHISIALRPTPGAEE